MHIWNDAHCTGCVHMFSIGRCSAYVYMKHMQMVSICVCHTKQMSYIWICSAYVGFSLFRLDPISGGSGSADRHPLPAGQETQYVTYPQLEFIPYVVFQALIVTCRSAADNGALLIFPPWYTSGNLLYARKPDLPETAIR